MIFATINLNKTLARELMPVLSSFQPAEPIIKTTNEDDDEVSSAGAEADAIINGVEASANEATVELPA